MDVIIYPCFWQSVIWEFRLWFSPVFCKSSMVCCMQESSTHHDYPSTFRNAFMVTNVHGHMMLVVCDRCLLHSFLMNFVVPCQKLNPFWGQNDIFFGFFAIVFLGENGTIVMSLPISSWDWLSHKSLLAFCLCSIISCMFLFISVCVVFWWCYLGNFPSSLDTNWPATIDAAAVCSLFLYLFCTNSVFFNSVKLDFWKTFAFETHYVKKRVLQVCLLLTYLAWDGLFGNGQSLAAEKRLQPTKVCSICGHGTRVYTFMGPEYIHSCQSRVYTFMGQVE